MAIETIAAAVGTKLAVGVGKELLSTILKPNTTHSADFGKYMNANKTQAPSNLQRILTELGITDPKQLSSLENDLKSVFLSSNQVQGFIKQGTTGETYQIKLGAEGSITLASSTGRQMGLTGELAHQGRILHQLSAIQDRAQGIPSANLHSLAAQVEKFPNTTAQYFIHQDSGLVG